MSNLLKTILSTTAIVATIVTTISAMEESPSVAASKMKFAEMERQEQLIAMKLRADEMNKMELENKQRKEQKEAAELAEIIKAASLAPNMNVCDQEHALVMFDKLPNELITVIVNDVLAWGSSRHIKTLLLISKCFNAKLENVRLRIDLSSYRKLNKHILTSFVRYFPMTQSLFLYNIPMTNDCIFILEQLKNIQALELPADELSLEGLQCLARIKTLTFLDLRDCTDIIIAGIQAMKENNKLPKTLNLKHSTKSNRFDFRYRRNIRPGSMD